MRCAKAAPKLISAFKRLSSEIHVAPALPLLFKKSEKRAGWLEKGKNS